MNLADRIARTLLYEGYALYPYRASSLKNQQRWTFGGLYPPGGVGEPSALHNEVISTGAVEVRVRFLQLSDAGAVEREVVGPGRIEFPAIEGGRPLSGTVEVDQTGNKVSVTVRNTGPYESPQLRSFASAHVVIHSQGELISMVDPAPEHAADVAACRNEVTWPVLLSRETMLCSPIILEDFPKVAPESVVELFDATEIDEILLLRVLTLSDGEKREIRSDPRVAKLLEKVEALTPEQMMKLHGTLRSAYRPGDRVVLHPKGRADVFDLALDGKRATVADTEHDVDGRVHLVVTVDEDPGAHRFFFRPDELERA